MYSASKKYLFMLCFLFSILILFSCSPAPKVYRFDDHLDEAIIKDKKLIAKHHSEGIIFEFDEASNDWISLADSYKLEIKDSCLKAKQISLERIEVELPEQLGVGIAHTQVLNPPYTDRYSSNKALIEIITSGEVDKISSVKVTFPSHAQKGDRPLIKKISPSPNILEKQRTITIIGDNLHPMAKVKFFKQGIKPFIKYHNNIIEGNLLIRNLNPLNLDTNHIREIEIKNVLSYKDAKFLDLRNF